MYDFIQHKVIIAFLNLTVLTRTWDSSNRDYLFRTTKLYFIKFEGIDLTEFKQYLSLSYYQSISAGLSMCHSEENLHELTQSVSDCGSDWCRDLDRVAHDCEVQHRTNSVIATVESRLCSNVYVKLRFTRTVLVLYKVEYKHCGL